jgi:hypothetical protein
MGDTVSAELALDMLGGFECFADEGQLDRLQAAHEELRRLVDAVPPSAGMR